MASVPRNIGAQLKTAMGPPAKAETPATVNGPAIDRMGIVSAQGYLSCVLHGQCGSATGSPTAQSYIAKLQDSATSGGTYADFTDSEGNGALTAITADDTDGRTNIDLSSAKRFVRVVRIVALTAGTTPALPCSETVVFGGAGELPQS